jgi:hypothetical protein
MALDATPGGPLANAYCDVVTATAYLQERLHVEAWYRADPGGTLTLVHRREAALIQATRLLDAQVGWYGVPATVTQALAWPQTGQVDSAQRPVDPTLIPLAVERATAYYALALLEVEDATQGVQQDAGRVIKSEQIGDTTITYEDARTTATPTAPQTLRVPNEVWLLVRPYGRVPGSILVPVLRT